jgi:very-short-patch-repair endonuclease
MANEILLLYPCLVCSWYGCSEEKHGKDEKTLQFIRKGREKYGWKNLDYSLTKYTRHEEKIIYVCEKHGQIEQNARYFLDSKRCGCTKCSGIYRYTTEEWIQKAREVHGNKYDYSKVIYKRSRDKVIIICPEHGEFLQIPSGHLSGKKCRQCSYTNRTREILTKSKDKFHKNIAKLGGKVIGKYKEANIPVECVCPKGHECKPRPACIQQGHGMCKACAGKCPKIAKQNFYKNIERLGGKVIGKYKGRDIPVVCVCPKGHECKPRPTCIQQGQGMCRTCAGKCPKIAKQNFYKNIERLGGKVIGKYKEANIPVVCVCPKGHECKPRPACIQQGQGMCKACAGNCPKTAKQNFYKNIERLGGKVIGKYKGRDIPVECVCPKGHECKPRPACIQQGQGMCRICWESRGEREIRLFFKYKNISVNCQHRVQKHPYKYDCFVPSINTLIEYDGEQHFDPDTHYNRKMEEKKNLEKGEALKRQKKRDLHKTRLALENGYHIVRISYTSYEYIKEIMTDILSNPRSLIVMSNDETINNIYQKYQELIQLSLDLPYSIK